jgi:hypothetical protein
MGTHGNIMNRLCGTLWLLVSMLAIQGCSTFPGRTSSANPVVGVWIVNDVDAPFPYHTSVFNGDGALQQASPDAGDPNSTDSDGKGIWIADRDRMKGK